MLDLADALDSSVEWARALEITLIHRPVATLPWHVALSRRLVTRPRDHAHLQAFRCNPTTGLFIPSLCPFRSHPRTGRPVIPALPPLSSTCRLPSSAPASPPRELPCTAHGTSPAGRQSAENSFIPTFRSGMLIRPIQQVIELLVPTYWCGASVGSLPSARLVT